MKNIGLGVLILLVLTVSACEINNDSADSTTSQKIESKGLYNDHLSVASIPSLDGHVNSWAQANTTADLMTVGIDGYVTYKSIVTFDTSQIPADATLTYAYLRLFSDEWYNCGGNLEDWYAGRNKLSVEIAGPLGFNYSYIITGFDYFALAMGYGDTEPAFFYDAFLFYHQEDGLNVHLGNLINRNGYTQIRLSVTSTVVPGCSIALKTGETSPATQPALFVYWQ